MKFPEQVLNDAGGDEVPRYPGPIGALVVDATGLLIYMTIAGLLLSQI